MDAEEESEKERNLKKKHRGYVEKTDDKNVFLMIHVKQNISRIFNIIYLTRHWLMCRNELLLFSLIDQSGSLYFIIIKTEVYKP